jgi:phosphoserine phosphatase
MPDTPSVPEPLHYVVTAVGQQLGARALESCLEQHGAHVLRQHRLSEQAPLALELHVALPAEPGVVPLRQALQECGLAGGFDVALQPESPYRRHRRMLVMDMDSTAIRIEVIDELARAHGVGEQVARITERAMRGEMDYDESLRQRVALLEGLEVQVLRRIADNLPLTPGVERLVRVLKHLGWSTAVISGGFSVAAEALQRRLRLDYAWSNVLEQREGRLTGRTVGEIVNAQRKAELLESTAQSLGLVREQVVAVGDGANDLLMIERAGLGVAFHAKPRLRQAAQVAIGTGGLDTLLYMLGLDERELRQAEAAGA